MKNFKIIAALIVVATSFLAMRFIGTSFSSIAAGKEDKKTFQTANLIDNAAYQPAGTSGDFNAQNNSEILSQNTIATSSPYLTNMACIDSLSLSAHLALIRFLNDNNKIYELNVDNRWPVASITKLITALVVEDNVDLSKSITFTDNEILGQNSAEKFKAGETYKASDLLKAMLLLSSNDAAEAFANDFGRDKFIDLMNQKAKDLNLSETSFFDPTGLSAKNQSTPNDIFKIVSYIYQNHPEILKITSQKSAYIVELNSKMRELVLNINNFAGQPDFIGGKTGSIDESGENLVSLFNVNREPVAIVVLGSQDRFGETKELLNCVQNSDAVQPDISGN